MMMYWYVLVCTCTYLYISIYNGTYYYVDLWVHAMKAPLTDFKEISVSQSTVHAGICQYILVYTSMYQHIPIHTK